MRGKAVAAIRGTSVRWVLALLVPGALATACWAQAVGKETPEAGAEPAASGSGLPTFVPAMISDVARKNYLVTDLPPACMYGGGGTGDGGAATEAELSCPTARGEARVVHPPDRSSSEKQVLFGVPRPRQRPQSGF